MTSPESIESQLPHNNPETTPDTTQLALRFKPLFGLTEIPLDSRILQIPYVLPAARKIATYLPLAKLDPKAPIPDQEIIQEFGLALDKVKACRICGSDRVLMYLNTALSNIADLPDIHDDSQILKIQNALFQTLAYLSPINSHLAQFHHKGKVIYPSTMGHEILVEDGAVFAPVHILNNKRIIGLALGFGAVIVDEQGQLLSELSGGFSKRVVVHPEKQIIKHDLDLATASGIDARACVKRAFEKIIGNALPINPSTDPNIPTVIIGFGTLGLTAADELRQNGFDMSKVVVVAKYSIQEKAAMELGCKVVNVHDPEYIEQLAGKLNTKVKRSGTEFWFEDGAPLVIDAVGSLESLNLSSHIIRNGYLIELGLPQEMESDLNRFSRNNSQIVLRRWAEPRHYQQAIDALSITTFPGWPEVTKYVSLPNIFEALNPTRALKEEFINFVCIPRLN